MLETFISIVLVLACVLLHKTRKARACARECGVKRTLELRSGRDWPDLCRLALVRALLRWSLVDDDPAREVLVEDLPCPPLGVACSGAESF